MSWTAFLFPGQGSQYVGMGQDLYETYPEVQAILDQADEVSCFCAVASVQFSIFEQA